MDMERRVTRWVLGIAAAVLTVTGLATAGSAPAAEAPTAPATEVRVDFGTSSTPSVTGFTKDVGSAFSSSTGLGWTNAAGSPVDMTANGRNRSATVEAQWKGLVQAFDKASQTHASWSALAVNGSWSIKVGVGDPSYYDSQHTVNVEGAEILSRWVPSKTTPFKVAEATVDVTDGRLNVAFDGGVNTKISWIDAVLVAPLAPEAPPAPAANAVWMYKPPVDGTTAESIAARYSSAILSPRDETFRDRLVAAGMPDPMMYFRFDVIIDPGSATKQPLRSQAAYNIGEFAGILRDHPTWFLRDAAGQPIIDYGPDGREFLMDPGSSGWRSFHLNRLRSYYEANGWKGGIMLDNVETNLKKRDRKGEVPRNYASDAAYTNAIAAMLKNIHDQWTGPANIPVVANMIEGNYDQADLDIRAKYMAYLDGMQHEAFGVTWSSGTWLSTTRWEWDLKRVELATSYGGQNVLFSQGNKDDAQRQAFSLGSYLLVKSDKTSFRYHSSKFGYGYDWWYSNYETKLGSPKGPRYQSGTKWVRDFTAGQVVVDPVAHTSTITLK